MSVYLDTHVVAWLYSGARGKLSKEAVRLIETKQLLISPMVVLELRYLQQRKRVSSDPGAVMAHLSSRLGLQICHLPFSATVQESLHISWTMDPFDVLIVGNAIANHKAQLITADQHILTNYPQSVW